ncbi:MAG TPA: SRPBCC domain-containing protein [Nitrososphaera sp.]|nr:SRPBCC domain-containing protein [Nitrososphaera sp.]
MKEIRTEIEINAGPEKVWKILSDFEKYEQWNPFIKRISGHAKEGSRIEIHIETPAGEKRRYEPEITKIDPERELRWVGKSWVLNGEHIFIIEQLQQGRVRFIQREVFDGLLTGFFGKRLDTDIKQGLEKMNVALKERAERGAL